MREKDLIVSWLWAKHRDNLQWRNVRLGIVPNKEMARIYSVLLRYVDAIVIENQKVLLIEAKVRPMPGAYGQLELYKELFYNTPEFSAYKTWPVEMVLLTTIMDLEMLALANKKGIRYELFKPSEVRETFKEIILSD